MALVALLLEHAIDLILVFHIQFGRALRRVDALTIDEKAERGDVDAFPLRVGVEDAFEPRVSFDFEKGLLTSLIAHADRDRQSVVNHVHVRAVGRPLPHPAKCGAERVVDGGSSGGGSGGGGGGDGR